MFRKSFDRSMLENVKERPIVCVHACTEQSLCTQLAFMRAWPAFMRTWTCSCIHVSILESMHTQFPTCIRALGACILRHGATCTFLLSRTLFLNPASSISYSNANITPFLHPFVGFVPIFRQGTHGCVVQGPYCRNKGLYSCSEFQADYSFATEEVCQCHSGAYFG